jgi:hypothetical protein
MLSDALASVLVTIEECLFRLGAAARQGSAAPQNQAERSLAVCLGCHKLNPAPQLII